MNELQQIFEEWEVASDEEDDNVDEGDGGAMTSQLRHFIAQPYIDPPLLLSSHNGRKFHVRTYVLAVGALKVFVYKEMLALFAAKHYEAPNGSEERQELDLAQHLTNTCFQDDSTRASSVYRFWELQDENSNDDWQDRVFAQICGITGEVFEAAAREQMIHFQALPNAFEVFGVDFLVDAEENVWLLEMNAYPDFKQTGNNLQAIVIGGLFEEITRVAIGPFFGSKGCEDGTERMPLVKQIDLGRS